MERIRHRFLELVLGLGLTAVLVLSVVLVWQSFSGAFSDDITVSAQLTQAGDALEQGDIVTYRRMIVGEVTSATGSRHGSAVATLRVHPADAKVIPAGVSAIAVPANLFGSTEIELLPMAHPAGPTLHDGDLIHADTRPAAESLQTALANAYTLLSTVHPAQLDAALSALATALDGQGKNLNRLIVKADRYLRRLAPHLPELDDVIDSLATVTGQLARDAPSLLASLHDLLTVSKGILASKQSVDELLSIGPTVLDNTQRLFAPRTVDNAVTILRDLGPVTAALAQHPGALVQTINGFRVFADTFNQTLAAGPYLKVNVLLTGANFAELVPQVRGGQGRLFQSIVDPPLYDARDCPRYAGASGPNCGAGADSLRAHVLTTGSGYGGGSSSVGAAAEVRTVRDAAGSITRRPARSLSGPVTDLLLGPMLRGSTTVVQ